MTKKSIEEQLEEIEKKQEQLKKQKQLLKNKVQSKQRKERTRQLIQIGALTEKIFNLDHTQPIEEIEKQLLQIADQIKK